VAISERSFNWGEIISKQLSTNRLQAETPKDGETPSFHMASYLLNVICAKNVFDGMSSSYMYMYTLAFCGKIGTKNHLLSSAMNL